MVVSFGHKNSVMLPVILGYNSNAVRVTRLFSAAAFHRAVDRHNRALSMTVTLLVAVI